MPATVSTSTELNDLALQVNVLKDGYTKLDERIKKLETPVVTPPASNVLLEDKFDTPFVYSDGSTSPDGKWKMKYVSGGKVESANGLLTMYPKTVTADNDTASTLLMSTKKFTDFQWDIDIKVNKQLRTGTPPKTWETGWIFWSYADEQEGPLGRSNHRQKSEQLTMSQ
jgi:hypothetical protein